jgi:hypothetical protein
MGGDGGQVIIVRPADSKFTIDQYKKSLIDNFTPKSKVTIKVVEEKDLPKVGL